MYSKQLRHLSITSLCGNYKKKLLFTLADSSSYLQT